MIAQTPDWSEPPVVPLIVAQPLQAIKQIALPMEVDR